MHRTDALSVSGLIFLAASFLRSRGLPTGLSTTATERGGGAVRDAQDGCAVNASPRRIAIYARHSSDQQNP